MASVETGAVPFVVALAKKYLAEVCIRSRSRVRVGDDVGDGLGQACEMGPIDVVGTRHVSGAERGPQSVRQIGEVVIRNKDVAKSLLLLFRERQERGLPNRTVLNAARYGEVRADRRSSFGRVRQHSDWSESAEHGHIGGRLRSRLEVHRTAQRSQHPKCLACHVVTLKFPVCAFSSPRRQHYV